MGAVYQAFDDHLHRSVAVKLAQASTDEEYLQRFSREAEVLSERLASLGHPGIVEYVAHGVTEGGRPYLVMEWLDGVELKNRVLAEPLTEAQTIAIGQRIASALSAAHARGVLHRDVKPSNLFLVHGEVERVKLIDFGLARLDASLTRSGRMLGTPGFMAPEQARGRRDMDARADIYSLGAVLCMCLTRQPPFASEHPMAVLAKLHLDQPPPVRELRGDVSPRLDQLIARLLAKDPRDRPASADDVAAELAGLDSGAQTSAPEIAPHAAPALGVSRSEQQFRSILLIGKDLSDGEDAPGLTDLARTYDADLATLRGGMVATFSAERDATEAATWAARFALAVHERYTNVPLALATGRSMVGSPTPVGEVIDRAAALLSSADATLSVGADIDNTGRDGDIVVDQVTAGLLESRFHLRHVAGRGYVLFGESVRPSAVRKILGKPTACVGREREINFLQLGYEECVDESQPRVILVTGPPGSGKSRVAHEFAHRLGAGAEPPRVLGAHGDPLRSDSPFGLLAEILRQAMGIVPSAPVAERRAGIDRHVRDRLPAAEAHRVAVFLGELMGAPWPLDSPPLADDPLVLLREARQDPRLMHDQMRQAWEDWLAAEAEVGPVVCVLDDLQWGDRATVRFVDAALRNLADRPFMILALARPEVHDRFPDLWSARDLEQIALKPLSRRACADLARQLIDVDDGVIDRLVARCGGNPFYLEELVRYAATGQLDQVPDTVLAVVSARLAALPPDERRALRAASVLGPAFWTGGVAALLNRPVTTAAGLIERLAERELVVKQRRSRFAADTEYAFPHQLIREAAYAMLPVADRQSAHRAAGAWLERAGESDPVALAEHFWRGCQLDRALPFFHRAAEQALEANDVAAVVKWAERAVRCGATGHTLGALRLLQAEAKNWSKDHADAYERGQEAMQWLERGSGAWAHAAQHVAWAAALLGHIDALEHVADELARCASDTCDELYLMAMAHCVTALASRQRTERMRALGDRIEARAQDRPLGHALTATLAHMKSFLAGLDGRTDEAATLSMRAIEHWNAAGNQRGVCMNEGNLGALLCELGQYEHSVEVLRACLSRAEHTGIEHVLQDHRPSLAMALARSGHVSEARALTRAFELSAADPRLGAVNRVFLAQIALFGNNPGEAAREAEIALDALDAGDHPAERAFALAVHAQALMALDRPGPALDAAGQGMRLCREMGALGEGDALVRLVHAEALHAAGDRERARQAIDAARARLLERAARIGNPRWRQSFLERVAENRRTLELARTWADA